MATPLPAPAAVMLRALLVRLTDAVPPRAVFRLVTKLAVVKGVTVPLESVMVPPVKSMATCCWTTPAALTTATLVTPLNLASAVGRSVPTEDPVNVAGAGTLDEALCALFRAFTVWVTNSLS